MIGVILLVVATTTTTTTTTATTIAAAAPEFVVGRIDRSARPAFRLSLEVDGSIILIAGALASSFFLLDEADAPECAPLCDRANINAFDRGVAGWYSPTWGYVGDVATASTLLIGPLALLVVEGWENGATDSLVVLESALAASAVQVIVSYAVGRPRPRVYGEEAPVDDRDDANAGRSFFSGHVANVVAATVATSIAFHRIDEPGWAWTSLALGSVGSAMVGAGRIGAGSHFPSDVLIGAAIGAGLGIMIPALHESPVHLAPLAHEDGAGLGVAGTF